MGPSCHGDRQVDRDLAIRAVWGPASAYGRRVTLRGRTRCAAYAVALALALACGVAPLAAAARADPGGRDVDVFTGTGGSVPWHSGNTTPAAARPFGLLHLGPDTTTSREGRPSATASGYGWQDDRVRGFSATHLSGAGCPAMGDVPFLPVVGRLPVDPAATTAGLDHDDEDAGPGWYRTRLASGVDVALAAGERTGLAVLTFPRGRTARLLVKGGDSLAGSRRTQVSFPSRREIAVSTTSGGFCGSPGHYRVHVVLRLARPMLAHGTWGGARPGGWVTLDRDGGTSRVQVAVSFVDVAGARRNLEVERPGWSYPDLRTTAAAAWARELGRVQVTGGTAQDRALLDTALYHALLHPTLVSDADGRYPGFDGTTRRLAPGERHYSAIAGWDAYRTQVPLLAWLRPDVASAVVRSLARMATQGGWLPRWPLVASYTGVMNGDSAAPLIAAAHAFGGRDFALDPLVTRLVRQGEQTDGAPGQGWFRPRPGLADYLRLGYVPNTVPERGWPQPHGASTTLEYAVDDFAVSRLALAAGRDDVAERFAARSRSWRTLLDPDRRLLLPRDAAGAFPAPDIDTGGCCNGFQEGNATQYTFGAVPQDVAGLLSSLGPRDTVVDRLDEVHTFLNAGAGSPHAWLGNQPSFLTPWAYLWLGEPARTADVVARARRDLWSLGPGGLPGNDDLGSLSAWFVWASLGLYPLTPGTPAVGITPPAFETVTVRPSSGSVTVIERVGTGRHVAGLSVDGVPTSASWLSLGPGSRPGVVRILTTDEPAQAWGTALADAPPSWDGPAQR